VELHAVRPLVTTVDSISSKAASTKTPTSQAPQAGGHDSRNLLRSDAARTGRKNNPTARHLHLPRAMRRQRGVPQILIQRLIAQPWPGQQFGERFPGSGWRIRLSPIRNAWSRLNANDKVAAKDPLCRHVGYYDLQEIALDQGKRRFERASSS